MTLYNICHILIKMTYILRIFLFVFDIYFNLYFAHAYPIIHSPTYIYIPSYSLLSYTPPVHPYIQDPRRSGTGSSTRKWLPGNMMCWSPPSRPAGARRVGIVYLCVVYMCIVHVWCMYVSVYECVSLYNSMCAI